MSLRSVNSITIWGYFLAACCDELSFALDNTPRLGVKGSLMGFLKLIRWRQTLNIQYSFENIQ
jgi:hypothetical protein